MNPGQLRQRLARQVVDVSVGQSVFDRAFPVSGNHDVPDRAATPLSPSWPRRCRSFRRRSPALSHPSIAGTPTADRDDESCDADQTAGTRARATGTGRGSPRSSRADRGRRGECRQEKAKASHTSRQARPESSRSRAPPRTLEPPLGNGLDEAIVSSGNVPRQFVGGFGERIRSCSPGDRGDE